MGVSIYGYLEYPDDDGELVDDGIPLLALPPDFDPRPVETAWSDLLNDPGRRLIYANSPGWLGIESDALYGRQYDRPPEPGGGD